jgi:hypothetical protein
VDPGHGSTPLFLMPIVLQPSLLLAADFVQRSQCLFGSGRDLGRRRSRGTLQGGAGGFGADAGEDVDQRGRGGTGRDGFGDQGTDRSPALTSRMPASVCSFSAPPAPVHAKTVDAAVAALAGDVDAVVVSLS